MHQGKRGSGEEGYRGDWATPQGLVDCVRDMLGVPFCFDLDVCATFATAKAPEYLGPDQTDPRMRDGLACNWSGHNWCNPPFDCGTAAAFARQAVDQALYHRRTALLVPATKADQGWFHELLASGKVEGIIWVRKRIPFEGRTGNPSPSVCLIIGPNVGRRSPAMGRIWREGKGSETKWKGEWI
jgi:hypothetical protein